MEQRLKRVLLVDTNIDGHHLMYLATIANSLAECVICVPEKIFFDNKNIKVVILPYDIEKGNLFQYVKWIHELKIIADKYHVEVIHFLTADFIVKYFGFLIDSLSSYRIVLTFHHFKHGMLRDFARKCLTNRSGANVVHTEALMAYVRNNDMKNFIQITYPCFLKKYDSSVIESRKLMGIPIDKKKVISAIGATRYDKGLDLLLAAIKKIDEDFYLLIAGKEDYFSETFIKSQIKGLESKIIIKLQYLSDEEMYHALNCSDVVILPYRKIFDGASGPLTDAVSLGKKVIGPDHGSLGKQISDFELGLTFKSEDIDDLQQKIRKAINENTVISEKMARFQKELSPSNFVDNYMGIY